jgi:hypothetical protein
LVLGRSTNFMSSFLRYGWWPETFELIEKFCLFDTSRAQTFRILMLSSGWLHLLKFMLRCTLYLQYSGVLRNEPYVVTVVPWAQILTSVCSACFYFLTMHLFGHIMCSLRICGVQAWKIKFIRVIVCIFVRLKQKNHRL